jgi:DNA polymerase I
MEGRMTGPLDTALAARPFFVVEPFAQQGDLLEPPDGVVVAAPDVRFVVDGRDGGALRELAAYALRKDRVVASTEARPALRRLLRAGVDVARPVCAATLAKLLDERAPEGGAVARSVEEANVRADEALDAVPRRIAALEQDGGKKVARLECLVLRSFAALEDRGLPIDAPKWRALVEQRRAQLQGARQRVLDQLAPVVAKDLFGTPEIHVDSDVEVKAALERLFGAELPDVARGTLGAIDHDAARAVLAYREAHKIVSTYGDAFLAHVDRRTGRIHATFVPLGASTGRAASRDPNLQNLPSDDEFHRALKAPDGRALVTADYGTCELRILAELSGDRVFLDAFSRGEDLHSTVAATMFGVPVSKTENAHLRHRAKGINFGLVYGMGAQGLSAQLKCPREEADALLAKYFATFPGVKRYLDESVDRALALGFAETVLGRRLRFDTAVLDGKNARGEK